MYRNKLGSSGFTLIEVLLAIIMAAIMIAVIAGSLQHSVQVQQRLAGRTIALVLGQGKLAELELGSENALSGEFAPPYNNFTWQAQEETVTEGLTVINLIVEWRTADATLRQKVLRGFRFSR